MVPMAMNIINRALIRVVASQALYMKEHIIASILLVSNILLYCEWWSK